MSPPCSRPARASLALLLTVAATAFCAGVVGYHFYRGQSTDSSIASSPPPRAGNDPVVALGRIRPAGGALTISGPPGDQIEELHVALGSVVTVPNNEPPQQRPALVTLSSRRERAAEVAVLERQIEDARRQREFAIRAAERQLELARQKLSELQTLGPLEIAVLQAKVPPLSLQLDHARKRRARLEELREKNRSNVSQQEIDDLQLLEKTSAAELHAASAIVDKAMAAHDQAISAAKLAVQSAEDSKARAEGDATVAALEAKLDLARLLRDRSVLRAPPGSWRVVKVWGQAGEPTAPQQAILQIAAAGPMIVVTEVYETDIERLRAWQKVGPVPAIIRSRALPRELAGTVASISDVIVRNAIMDIDPAADVDRRVFEVQVALDAASSAIAAGFLNLQVQVELKP